MPRAALPAVRGRLLVSGPTGPYPAAAASPMASSPGSVMHGLTDPSRCAAHLCTVVLRLRLPWLSGVVALKSKPPTGVSRGRLLVLGPSWALSRNHLAHGVAAQRNGRADPPVVPLN